METNVITVASRTIHSKTIRGEYMKQTFNILCNTDGKKVLLIKKLILTDNTDRFELFERNCFVYIKKFNNKRLYKNLFSIELTSFQGIMTWINEQSH